MIQLTEKIWVGDSSDEQHADVHSVGINAILNVAQDLQATRGWEDLTEYMQVGLIDGPGNPMSAYYAAVLALHALLSRGAVLICCHDGGRSLAVVLMYLHILGGHGWDNRLAAIRERITCELPVPNAAHKKAFDRLHEDWRYLAAIMEN